MRAKRGMLSRGQGRRACERARGTEPYSPAPIVSELALARDGRSKGLLSGSGNTTFLLKKETVRNGRLTVADKRPHVPADITLQEIGMDVRHLATVTGRNRTCRLEALTTEGRLSLKAVRAAILWTLFSDRANLEPPAGRIDVASEFRSDAATRPVWRTVEELYISAVKRSLRLAQAENVLLRLKTLEPDAARFDGENRDLPVGRLRKAVANRLCLKHDQAEAGVRAAPEDLHRIVLGGTSPERAVPLAVILSLEAL